jgi:hypothetical protein
MCMDANVCTCTLGMDVKNPCEMTIAGCASAGATSSGDGGGFCRASCVRCCVLGRFFG